MLFHKKRISFSYCGDKTPNPVILNGNAASMGLKVMFTSDQKTAGSGAQCTAMCLDCDSAAPTLGMYPHPPIITSSSCKM